VACLFRRMDRRYRLQYKAAGSLKLLSDDDAKFDVIIDDQGAIGYFHDDQSRVDRNSSPNAEHGSAA